MATPPPRRPFYYPAGIGCLFWLLVFLAVWALVGVFWRPLWWPWWW